tara:strand:+ start:337 stop:558 length:222 start_codon:yes stop_codon:yes gene_type:complete
MKKPKVVLNGGAHLSPQDLIVLAESLGVDVVSHVDKYFPEKKEKVLTEADHKAIMDAEAKRNRRLERNKKLHN